MNVRLASAGESIEERAYRQLYDEFLGVWHANPSSRILPNDHSLAWHVYDAFSGRSGDEILHEMLRIVSLTAVDTGAAAQRRAASLMQELADAHAKFFEADLVDREQD